MALDRTKRGRIGRWWWTMDRWLFLGFLLLMIISAVLVTASSPPVARRIGFEPYHFVLRQHIFLVLSVCVMIGTSMLSATTIRRIASLGLVVTLLIMCTLPFTGADAKGATRWLHLGGFSLQPSEFMKPFFVITIGWILSERQKLVHFPAYRISFVLFAVAAGLLVLQPDIGMMMTLTMLYGIQLFLSGIPIFWVMLLIILGMVTLAGAYMSFPHVANRINGFLDPSSVDNYQVQKSLESFESGGLLGQGPGEGEVKWQLPDAHTDFIFAVVGEEFGMLLALVLIGVFMVLVLRGLWRAAQMKELFVMLSVTGLVAQIGLQAFINMGVAVHLLPAKGMTLPFLSYGGSSLLAVAFTAGAILGLTRRQYGTLPRGKYYTLMA